MVKNYTWKLYRFCGYLSVFIVAISLLAILGFTLTYISYWNRPIRFWANKPITPHDLDQLGYYFYALPDEVRQHENLQESIFIEGNNDCFWSFEKRYQTIRLSYQDPEGNIYLLIVLSVGLKQLDYFGTAEHISLDIEWGQNGMGKYYRQGKSTNLRFYDRSGYEVTLTSQLLDLEAMVELLPQLEIRGKLDKHLGYCD